MVSALAAAALPHDIWRRGRVCTAGHGASRASRWLSRAAAGFGLASGPDDAAGNGKHGKHGKHDDAASVSTADSRAGCVCRWLTWCRRCPGLTCASVRAVVNSGASANDVQMTALLSGLQQCAHALRADVLRRGFEVCVGSSDDVPDAAAWEYTVADARTGNSDPQAVLDAVCSGDADVFRRARGSSDDWTPLGADAVFTVEWMSLRALLRSVVATLVHVSRW